MSMENSNDTIGNRTRDLPFCSAGESVCAVKDTVKSTTTVTVKDNVDTVQDTVKCVVKDTVKIIAKDTVKDNVDTVQDTVKCIVKDTVKSTVDTVQDTVDIIQDTVHGITVEDVMLYVSVGSLRRFD